MTDEVIRYRDARATDAAYVMNSWVTSIYGPKANWGARGAKLNTLVERLLDDSRTKVLVACAPHDEDAIVGWIAYAHAPGLHVIEYMHVRQQRRREGIARAMVRRANFVAGVPLAYLFVTDEGERMLTRSPQAIHIKPEEFLP